MKFHWWLIDLAADQELLENTDLLNHLDLIEDLD